MSKPERLTTRHYPHCNVFCGGDLHWLNDVDLGHHHAPRQAFDCGACAASPAQVEATSEGGA